MAGILIFILGILVGGAAVLYFYARREAAQHGTGTAEEVVGICKSAIETASQKEARKDKVLTMLREKTELSNTDIRKALGVSSRTAVRYMDELEKEGKVEQIGKIGYAVTYRLK